MLYVPWFAYPGTFDSMFFLERYIKQPKLSRFETQTRTAIVAGRLDLDRFSPPRAVPRYLSRTAPREALMFSADFDHTHALLGMRGHTIVGKNVDLMEEG